MRKKKPESCATDAVKLPDTHHRLETPEGRSTDYRGLQTAFDPGQQQWSVDSVEICVLVFPSDNCACFICEVVYC